MLLFHTGHQQIFCPDVHIGRANADFGQGFYLTEDGEFAMRWARIRPGMDTFVNTYELDLGGLEVHRFERDADWFDYIFANRSGRPDALADVDAIIGPIANDTIYNTYGLITSGLMPPEQALELLRIGPAYVQVAIKTERAANRLTLMSARKLNSEEVLGYRDVVAAEEAAYQEALAAALELM